MDDIMYIKLFKLISISVIVREAFNRLSKPKKRRFTMLPAINKERIGEIADTPKMIFLFLIGDSSIYEWN